MGRMPSPFRRTVQWSPSKAEVPSDATPGPAVTNTQCGRRGPGRCSLGSPLRHENSSGGRRKTPQAGPGVAGTRWVDVDVLGATHFTHENDRRPGDSGLFRGPDTR